MFNVILNQITYLNGEQAKSRQLVAQSLKIKLNFMF